MTHSLFLSKKLITIASLIGLANTAWAENLTKENPKKQEKTSIEAPITKTKARPLISKIKEKIAQEKSKGLNLPVVEKTLDNGLKVILLERKESPVVACRLFYTTGSVHEVPGQAGLAHYLEHMLFKGTAKVGVKDLDKDTYFLAKTDSLYNLWEQAKNSQNLSLQKEIRTEMDSVMKEHGKYLTPDELWQAYQAAGGTGLNAFTSDLMTAYFVTLPANKVELFFWLEADRMENAIFREFMPERDVVREERRMRYDDSPYGRYFESLIATFYEEHPYRIPTIGWPSDIENLSKAQITEHYQKYYKPNNAILVLAGNFDSPKTLKQIERYFGNIKKGEDHATLTIKEPTQVGAKRLTQYKADAKPRYDLLFQAPEVGQKDAYALEVLAGILSGQGGRLYRRLVEKEGLALGTDAGLRAQKYISSFEIDVNYKPNLKLEEVNQVEEIVWQEIQKIQNEGVSEKELMKVRNQAVAASVRAFEGLEHAANQLAFNELYGSWKLVQDWPIEIAKITAADVKRVANTYLKHHLSTTGQMLEPGQRPAWQSKGNPTVKDEAPELKRLYKAKKKQVKGDK